MTNKIYNQKPGGFSFLRFLLLTLIVFCCLFLGHYFLNVFFFKTIKTNSGLTYRVVKCEDLIGQPFKPLNDIKESGYILYQQEISYKGKIIKHYADFTRKYKCKDGVCIAPYFMYLDNSSLSCIDGGICELLNLCKGGDILEAEVLAYTVLPERTLFKYKIYDTNTKVKVRVYPFSFCPIDKIEDQRKIYDTKMVELQTQQRISNKEKIKDILKKKYPGSAYTEVENGFFIKKNDVKDQEHIDENSTVSFDMSIYNITTGEFIFTTLLDDAIKNVENINVTEYKPMVLNVNQNIYPYFKNFSPGGEYEIYTPFSPQFLGDTQIYLIKIKNLEVKTKGDKSLNDSNAAHSEEHEASNNVVNLKDSEEKQDKEEGDNSVKEKADNNINQEDNEKQDNIDEIDGEKEDKTQEENDNSNDINNGDNINREGDEKQ